MSTTAVKMCDTASIVRHRGNLVHTRPKRAKKERLVDSIVCILGIYIFFCLEPAGAKTGKRRDTRHTHIRRRRGKMSGESLLDFLLRSEHKLGKDVLSLFFSQTYSRAGTDSRWKWNWCLCLCQTGPR